MTKNGRSGQTSSKEDEAYIAGQVARIQKWLKTIHTNVPNDALERMVRLTIAGNCVTIQSRTSGKMVLRLHALHCTCRRDPQFDFTSGEVAVRWKYL